MVATYLDALGEFHRRRAAADGRDWRARLDSLAPAGPSLEAALRSDPVHVAVIAEIKRKSPSKGWLAADIDAVTLARQYEAAGAAAISVLTDTEHFGGALDDLRAVSSAVSVPRLRKDFTVCENDILDAAEAGAGAVLLIVALLTDAELSRFSRLATQVGLDALIEVHDAPEVDQARAIGATLIGINQRDLHSFHVDTDRAARLAASLPDDVVRVCESGLASRSDVERAAAAGFHAVLVGEAFVTSPDPAATVREFASVAR